MDGNKSVQPQGDAKGIKTGLEHSHSTPQITPQSHPTPNSEDSEAQHNTRKHPLHHSQTAADKSSSFKSQHCEGVKIPKTYHSQSATSFFFSSLPETMFNRPDFIIAHLIHPCKSSHRVKFFSNSILQVSPGLHGIAFIVGILDPFTHRHNVIDHMCALARMFRQLKFTVFEEIDCTKEVIADIVSKSKTAHIPKSQDYPFVLIVVGTTNWTDSCSFDSIVGNIDVRKDIIDPFLPPLAPHLAVNTKIFIISTLTSFVPMTTDSLNVPSEGNFLLSYMRIDPLVFSDSSRTLVAELRQSTDSLEEILTRVSAKLPQPSATRLVSCLTNPVHLISADQSSVAK